MLPRSLLLAPFALAALLSAAPAQAAFLTLGTTNTANAPTTLTGTTAGPELKVVNANASNPALLAQSTGGGTGIALYGQHTSAAGAGPSIRGDSASTAAGAFSIYGLLSSTSPGAGSAAVLGRNNGTNANGYGVLGSHAGSGTGVYGASVTGKGVYGVHSSTGGAGAAVRGDSASTVAGGTAVYGLLSSTAPGANSAAVRAENKGTNTNGYGVYATHAGGGTAVYGQSANGSGVIGTHTSATGSSPGVTGATLSADPSAIGVFGRAVNSSAGSNSAAVYGQNLGTMCCDRYGVWGEGPTGVYGNSMTIGGYGVRGEADAGTSAAGVYGFSSSGDGGHFMGFNQGVRGESSTAGGGGVFAQSTGTNGYGVSGVANFGAGAYGVFGSSSSGYAGYFQGKVNITGGCTGCVSPGGLRIDDPRDPAHRYLQHSPVASSEQLDLYSGNVVTDRRGFATVRMPNWFRALNRSFRYQLTSLSGLQEVAVAKEMSRNQFVIQSRKPHSKVSWQVTAVRHDPYSNVHRGRVVVPKPAGDQGRYLHPELYGKPRSLTVGRSPRFDH